MKPMIIASLIAATFLTPALHAAETTFVKQHASTTTGAAPDNGSSADFGRGRRGWQQTAPQPVAQPQADWQSRAGAHEGGRQQRPEAPVFRSDRETGVESPWNPRHGRGHGNYDDQGQWRDQRQNNDHGYDNHQGDNHGWSNTDRRRYDHRHYDHRRWDHSWRTDHRYNWRSHRDRYGDHYRIGRYYAPYPHHSYRRFSVGFHFGSPFYHHRYWINNPWDYRLPEAYGPYRWVRYYRDVVLIDLRNGHVVDVIYGFFW